MPVLSPSAKTIKVNHSLTKLDLDRNDIIYAGATSIAVAIKVGNALTNLNLSGYQINDAVLLRIR